MQAVALDWMAIWAELEAARTPVALTALASRHGERLAGRTMSAHDRAPLPRRADVEAAVKLAQRASMFP